MSNKEHEATDALVAAIRELDAAILKCGDAEFSFMSVIEPLLGARECVNAVFKVATDKA